MTDAHIITGDARVVLAELPAESVQMAKRDASGRFLPGTHWRPHRIFREPEYLEREYATNGRSAASIASEHGVTENAILSWLSRHGIPRRTMAQVRQARHWGVSGEANPMFGKTGALNPRYVDGSSPDRQRAYAQAQGRAFLRSVYERDCYRCRRCDAPKSGPRSLHAHHLRTWAGNPELRFDPNNAITLCRPCHNWVHSRANVGREWLA